MDIRKLSEAVSISPQVRPGQATEIVRSGFRSIICNRPDGEEQDQPAAGDVGAAAKPAGLEFAFVPALARAPTDADARLIGRGPAGLPRPILAYCRSGARSTNLVEMAGAAPSQRSERAYDIAIVSGRRLKDSIHPPVCWYGMLKGRERFVTPHPIGS